MNVLLFAIPIALLISLMAVGAFVYLVRSGQLDDLETPPRRILFDDVESVNPAPCIKVTEATQNNTEPSHEN